MVGDAGFRDFYTREFGSVFRATLLLCGDRNLAEGATQEAFVRALERWHRVRDQPWAGGWVTSTALNLGRRALRRHRSPDVPASEAPTVDAVIDVRRAIARLPLRQQQAVVLYYGTDLPIRDVARAMGCGKERLGPTWPELGPC